MIKRLLFGVLIAAGLISIGQSQIGPVPGAAVLPPPKAAGCSPCVPCVTNIGTANNTAGSTVSVSGVTVPAGSLIVVVVGEAIIAGGTVSDGVNTYTSAPGINDLIFFYAANASLSSGTITYTKRASGDESSISAIYVSGMATSSPEDSAVRANSNTTGTSISLTSGTPGTSGELFVGGLFLAANNTTVTQDTGDGWSFPPNTINGTSTTESGGTLVNAGTGTKTWAPSFGVSSSPINAAIVGFKHC